MAFLSHIIEELKTTHRVKAKFALVGVWNSIFGYIVFCVMDTIFPTAYMFAMVLTLIVTIINAYIFHKYITFMSEARGKAIIGEFARFTTTYLVAIFLSLILLPCFVEFAHMPHKMAVAFISLICMAVSYGGHSKFSFRSRSE